MFAGLEATLIGYAQTLPLEWFVFIASIIEEIIAPIPSPTVMVVSGSLASIQHYTFIGLIVLSCIGALGKTFGGLVVYVLAFKAEHFVIRRFGSFFNVSYADISALSAKLGTGFREYFMMTVFRALPFIPSVVVSVGSGILKVPLRIFIISTFAGTIIRDGFYLYTGYLGTEVLTTSVSEFSKLENYIEYGVILLISLGISYYFYKHKFSLK